jgi:hypothetical protein
VRRLDATGAIVSKPPRPPEIPPRFVDATHELLDRADAVWVSPRLPGVAFARDRRGRTYLVRATGSGVTCTCGTGDGACIHRFAAMVLWAEHAEDEAEEFARQREMAARLDAEIEEALGRSGTHKTVHRNGHLDAAILNGNSCHVENVEQLAQCVEAPG